LKGRTVNTKGYTEELTQRIERQPAGYPFVATDFSDIADTHTIRRLLGRKVDKGELRRAANGVFLRPRFSELFGEEVPPNTEAVAKAVARSHNWTIAPSGQTALNSLGLSTQVPAVWTYVTDGPYTTHDYDGIKVTFKHTTNKNITGMSPTTLLVVQAIRALGKDGITNDVVEKIAERLSDDEKQTLLRETARTTAWVRSAIRRVCER
jgi:hypothetical protein